MTAITFYSDDKSILQKFLDLALQFNVKTQIEPVQVDLTDEQIWVQSQLTEKYVKTDEWKTMNDDDRQDAALLEMMLYGQMQPDYEVYTVDETQSYLTHLKQELYAVSGQQGVS